MPEGEFKYELVDPAIDNSLAVLDLAWPNGLQEGLSKPVAILIDEDSEMEELVNRAGYLFFTDIGEFRTYVLREILAVSPEAIAVSA